MVLAPFVGSFVDRRGSHNLLLLGSIVVGVAFILLTRRAALRTPALWALIFAMGFSYTGIVAANLHLVPYVQELGYPITVAAIVVGARGYVGFIANPILGFLMERVPMRAMAASQFALCAVGIAMFLLAGSEIGLAAALLVFGLASMGFYMIGEVIWADYFGRISLGTVRGIAQPIVAAFAAVGPLAVGIIYDMSGGYELAWITLAVGFLLAAGAILLTGRPRPAPLGVGAR